MQVQDSCVDNPYFANCKLIVKARYCGNKYYAKFCCRSCTLAGQTNSSCTAKPNCIILPFNNSGQLPFDQGR